MSSTVNKTNISNISRIKSLLYILNYIPSKLKIKLFISLILILAAGIFEAQTIRYISIIFDQLNDSFFNENSFKLSTNSSLFIFFVLSSAISRIVIFRVNANIGASICNYLSSIIFKELTERDYELSLNDKENVDQDLLTLQVTKTGGIINNFLIALSAIFISLFIIYSIRSIGINYIFILLITFTFSYLIIGNYIRDKLRFNSKKGLESTRSIVKKISEIQCLRSEINLGLNPKPFLDDFNETDKIARMANASSTYLGYLPRYLIEGIFLAFGVLFLTIFFSGQSKIFSIASLGMVAFAFQKLLPNAQQIFQGWSVLNANGDSLIEINKVLRRLKNKPYRSSDLVSGSTKINNWNSIKINNISYQYKTLNGEKFQVFRNLNFSIYKGQKIAICGPSGTGKSTLIKLICGLLKPKYGEILIDDKNIHRDALVNSRFKKLIAYVPQQTQILNKSIIYNLILDSNSKSFNDKKLLKLVLKCCILEDFIDSQTNGIETIIGFGGKSISGGQKQRIAIARALLLQRDILILDESTSSLDQNTEVQILDNIHKLFKNQTIIHISHNPETLNKYNDKFFIEELKN